MIKIFNAAVLDKINRPLKIVRNIKLPKLKKDQILVKMKYTAVCGSQLFEINGKRGKDIYIPHLLGHEGTGQIVKAGDVSSKFKKKDKVFLSWISKDNFQTSKILFDYPNKNKSLNAGPVTTFSTYTIVSKNKVYHLPKKISLKKGVLLGCAIPTGAGMVFNQSNNLEKKTTLVIGAGGVGLSSILALKIKKTKKIIVYEPNKKKILLLRKYMSDVIFYDDIKKIVKTNILFDYVYDCSGITKSIELGFKLLKDTGKCIFATHPEFKKKISFDPYEFIKGKKLEGSWGGKVKFSRDLNNLTKLILKFKFIEKLYFRRIYSLNEINKAIKDFKNGKNIRTLIRLN